MAYKILYATDLHGRANFYNKIFNYAKENSIEAIIFGGDITPWKSNFPLKMIISMQSDFLSSFLIPALRTFRAEYQKDVFVMMGNDDCKINLPMLERGEKEGLYKLMHMRQNKIGEFNLIGYSFVPLTPFRLKDWEKYEDETKQIPLGCIDLSSKNAVTTSGKTNEGSIRQDIEAIRKMSDPKETIYAMHSPPFNTALDICYDGTHCGSRTIRDFIEKEQPYLTLHGHIHESHKMSGRFMEKIGKTPAINPGALYTNDKASFLVINLLKPEKAKIVRV